MTLAEAAAVASIVGTGASIIGQQKQASAARAQAAHQQAQMRNQQIVLQQDAAREKEAERTRQKILGEAGAKRLGEIRTALAASGQVVDLGSAADIPSDLAAEVAFKKLVSQDKSARLIRNLGIEAQTIEGRIGASRLEARAASSAANTKSFSTVLTSGSRLASTFKFDSGKLSFRTKRQ